MFGVKIPTWLIAFVIFLLFLVFSYFYAPVRLPQTEFSDFKYVESPLLKNSNLMLKGGEQYVYVYSSDLESANLTFVVEDTGKCIYLSTPDIRGGGACLNNEGNDYAGSNVSFLDPNIFMFRPWMLAVEKGWEWNVSVYLVTNVNESEVFDIKYRTIRTDIINGRRAYVVEIDQGGGVILYEWIDAEKRILVKETGAGAEIELVEGLGG